jgi:hypothetical protein
MPTLGRTAMRSFGIADELQLTSLTQILDDFCTEFGVANGDEEREEIGRCIMALFNCGYSIEQIEQALRQASVKAA